MTGQRSNGRKGWGGGTGALTPTQLTSVYNKGQFWVPAGALTVGANDGATGLKVSTPSASSASYTVMEFATGVLGETFFTWAFKSDFVASTMNLIITPIWFLEIADASTIVTWEGGASNAQLGTTLSFDNSGNEIEMKADTVAIDVVTSGDETNIQRGIPISVIGDDLISDTDWNLMTIMMERHGDEVSDTCDESAMLLGLGIQFDTDFDNIAAWPTA